MPTERLSKIRDVLRLRSESGLSERMIARSLSLSNGSVNSYPQRARAAGLVWPLPETLDDGAASFCCSRRRRPRWRRPARRPTGRVSIRSCAATASPWRCCARSTGRRIRTGSATVDSASITAPSRADCGRRCGRSTRRGADVGSLGGSSRRASVIAFGNRRETQRTANRAAPQPFGAYDKGATVCRYEARGGPSARPPSRTGLVVAQISNLCLSVNSRLCALHATRG